MQFVNKCAQFKYINHTYNEYFKASSNSMIAA